MNRTIAQYKEHDLVFDLDVDENFWFIIKDINGEHIKAVAFGDAQFAINKEGSVDAFIDNQVIPRANTLLESYFGEVPELPDDAPWQEQLEVAIRNLKFTNGKISR